MRGHVCICNCVFCIARALFVLFVDGIDCIFVFSLLVCLLFVFV